jgi:endogenous inhibitor of DNA gyrase (YacG/DUF329 family)
MNSGSPAHLTADEEAGGVPMSDLRRRVAYLRGLAERYDLAESGREGRVLSEVIQVLREMALDVDEMAQSQRDIEDYVEAIDNDLLCLEECVYENDTGDESAPVPEEPEETPPDEDKPPELDGDTDPDTYIELECPSCHRPVYFAEHLFAEDGIQLTCPHCGHVVFDAREDHLLTEPAAEAEAEYT